MPTALHFGSDQRVALDLSDESIVADNTRTSLETIDDPSSAIQTALRDPIEFPPIEAMVLADDLVALALQPDLACAPELVAGAIEAVTKAGVPPDLIQIVRDASDKSISDTKLMAKVDGAIRERIAILRHDSQDREHLSFLGASKDGQAFYVNRTLCDASVVIPIGFHRNHASCLGVHNSWFPVFADKETQDRFAKSVASLSSKKISKCEKECEEAAWMLGVQMVVQLIPGGDGRAMQVIAGSPNAVWQKSTQLADDAWRVNLDRRASLVIAAIGGGPEQQTWDNVAQSIDMALDAVEVDGAIAICSQLKTKPGPALRRLAGAEDFEAADRAILKKPTTDTLAASRLNRALQRARVYLLSELKESDVEDLGVAFVSDASEISRLTAQHESCLVLQNAQHVSISLDERVEH